MFSDKPLVKPKTNPRIRVLSHKEYVEEIRATLREILAKNDILEFATFRLGKEYHMETSEHMHACMWTRRNYEKILTNDIPGAEIEGLEEKPLIRIVGEGEMGRQGGKTEKKEGKITKKEKVTNKSSRVKNPSPKI